MRWKVREKIDQSVDVDGSLKIVMTIFMIINVSDERGWLADASQVRETKKEINISHHH